MSEAKKILAASIKAFERRQEERAFSNASEDVRAWEPMPTLEIARSFRPRTTPSMYKTIQTIMDPKTSPEIEVDPKFRWYD